MKLPFMKFFPMDWINDTRSLSPSAKGCWIDLLCLMWNAPKRGIWEGSFSEFSRVTGSPENESDVLLLELQKVASVTLHNKNVTLVSRRMLREQKRFENNMIRQRRHRMSRNGNAKVTPQTLDVRRHKRLTEESTPTSRDASGDSLEVVPSRPPDLSWKDIPESERMTPEEMKAIRLKTLGRRP